jgi:hypothetical protein
MKYLHDGLINFVRFANKVVFNDQENGEATGVDGHHSNEQHAIVLRWLVPPKQLTAPQQQTTPQQQAACQ